MRAYIINGSPRTQGGSAQLLDLAAEAFRARDFSVEQRSALDLLSALDTPFCTHCSPTCVGECYAQTAVEDFYRQLPEADCMLVASPVYFGTVSAELKALWDFGRRTRSDSGLLYTVGGALAVGGGRFGGQETTLRAIHDMMLIQGMIVVGDSSEAGIGHQGVAAQDPGAEDHNARKRLDILVDAMADVSRATRDLRRRVRGE